MSNFQNLIAWRVSHELTVDVFRLTSTFSRGDSAFLALQMRRSASSIGANIAEGAGQESKAQFARFLSIAMGSATELANHALLARDLGFLTADEEERIAKELDRVRAMLSKLRASKRRSALAEPRQRHEPPTRTLNAHPSER